MDPSSSNQPAVGLAAVPSELLMEICDILGNTSPASVVAFALTNRRNYYIAQSTLMWTIRVDDVAKGREDELSRSITSLTNRLLRDGSWRYVSRIILGMEPKSLRDEVSAKNRDIPSLMPLEEHIDEEISLIHTHWASRRHGRNRDLRATIRDAYETEERWDGIVSLIDKLPALKDFVFAANGQLPPRILGRLAAKNPSVRVHLYNFDLWSPGDFPRRNWRLDPRELQLITSPMLHTISILWGCSNLDRLQYCEVLGQLVSGLVPNLKVFRTPILPFKTVGDASGDASGTPTLAFDPTQPILIDTSNIPNYQPRNMKGSLTSLQIDYPLRRQDDDPRPNPWQYLRHCTDLSRLDTLKINRLIEPENLAGFLVGADLSNLKALRLRVDLYAPLSDAAYGTMVFLRETKLPKLETLEIKAPYDVVYSYITGPNLRVIRLLGQPFASHGLTGAVTNSLLERLAKNCPRLEEVHLPMRPEDCLHVNTNNTKVGVNSKRFGTIGRLFPYLRDLTVCFTETRYRNDNPMGIGIDAVPISMDEDLAKSMFDVINSSREGGARGVDTCTMTFPTLDRLSVMRPHEVVLEDMIVVRPEIEKMWVVSRGVIGDDGSEQVSVTSMEYVLPPDVRYMYMYM